MRGRRCWFSKQCIPLNDKWSILRSRMDCINKIICGDCLDVMRTMPDACVDLAVTSPPYNLKNSTGNGMKDGRGGRWAGAALMKGYSHHDDCMPHDSVKPVEICNHCGKSVALGSGNFVNRIPDFNELEVRKFNQRAFPRGDFVCERCDEHSLVSSH